MDDFGNRSFEQYFQTRLNNDGCYVKTHFDVTGFSNNTFSDNTSVIGRMGNLMKNALDSSLLKNKISPLPKLIVVVPEDDIIRCLSEFNSGLTKNLGRLVNYIMIEHERGISSFKENLPAKAKREGYPHILWILPPSHDNFHNNAMRYKFNKCVEDMAKYHTNVSCLELKKVWNAKDDGLYVKDQKRFTIQGYKNYWEAVDRTVRYCDSVSLKKKTTKNTKPNHCQNDKFRWRNPKVMHSESNYQEFKKLPEPPRRR